MNGDFAFATDLIQTDPWPIARQALVIAEVGIIIIAMSGLPSS